MTAPGASKKPERRKKSHVITIRPAAAAVTAALAIALAAPAGAAPVAIERCSILRAARGNIGAFNYYPYGYYGGFGGYNGFAGGYPGIGAPVTDGIRINYKNTSRKVADRVAFGVDYRGQRDVIVDSGTFSPGISIDHTFGEFSGLAYLGNRPNSCRVLSIRYKDGTIFRAPGMGMRPQSR